MILTVASAKGGVGKTTTAVCLAAVLQEHAKTLLIDDAATKIATKWSKRGDGFPFPVEPMQALALPDFAYKVIDSDQAPTEEDLRAAAKFSRLIILPTPPNAMDIDGLILTIQTLRQVGAANYRVLLTQVERDARREADELKVMLAKHEAPMFETEIPRLKAFKKAAAQGCLVRDVKDPNADRAWAAYKAVGEELRAWL